MRDSTESNGGKNEEALIRQAIRGDGEDHAQAWLDIPQSEIPVHGIELISYSIVKLDARDENRLLENGGLLHAPARV